MIIMKRHLCLLIYLSLLITLFSACTPNNNTEIIHDNSKYTSSTLFEDMEHNNYVVKLGINVDNESYNVQLTEFNQTINLPHGAPIFNIYTVRNPYTLEYGYIYEIHNSQALEAFFQNRCEFSMSHDEITFIYEIDYYVLEMYHSAQSDFVNILENHEFEANYQYDMFYSNEIEHHPFITNLLDGGAVILEDYTNDDLYERGIFSRSPIDFKYIVLISYLEQGNTKYVLVIEARNRQDALTGYYEQGEIVAFPGNVNEIFISYQNLIIIIHTMEWYDYSQLEALMEGKEYKTYDISNYWHNSREPIDGSRFARWER